ncbi:transposase [Chenggangzhangella methanolivorans]|uniref:helix-turn-helix domain-containing protein n=1 Tax=Chenggangzhangella methanolivorans TaxID=1437009 RepID=UPI00360D1D27
MPDAEAPQPFMFVIGERTAPDRVVPKPGESLVSILTRLLQASGHDSLTALCGPVGLPQFAVSSPARYVEAAKDFAELCGLPLPEIEGRMYLDAGKESEERNLRSVGGVVIRDRFLSTNRRAISPESLRKDPYHRSVWDIVPLGFCPESLEVLVENCPDPDCGRPLRWGGSSMTHCIQCGFDLRTAPTSRVSAEEATYLVPLAHLLSGIPTLADPALLGLPEILGKIPPGEILHLALMLGLAAMPVQSGALRKQIMHGHSKQTDISLLAAGMKILFGWPQSFSPVVDNVRSQAMPVKGRDPLGIELGIIADLTDPEISDPAVCDLVSAALHDYYDRNLDRLKHTPYPSVLLRWARSTMSAQEAADVLGATVQRVARLKVYPELVLTGGTSGKPFVFQRSAVEALRQEQTEIVSLTELALEEKIAPKLLRELVDAGFISVASDRASTLYQTPDMLVNRQKWRELRSRIEAMPRGVGGRTSELRIALAQAGGTAEVWIDVLNHLLSGRLRIFGVKEGVEAVGNRWEIDKAEVMAFLNSQAVDADVRPLTEACNDMGIKPTPANHLAKHGHIETTVETIGGFKYLVSREAIARFKRDYILSTELSELFAMTPKAIKAWLNEEGVHEIQYTKWDIPLVFVRKDVDAAIARISDEIGHVSEQVAAGKVAWIKYLHIPTTSTAAELKAAADKTHFEARKRSLLAIADILSGLTVHEVAERYGVAAETIMKVWLPNYRKHGLSVESTRVTSSKSLLSAEQRDEFEVYARRLIQRIQEGERGITLATLTKYVNDKFGIQYHKASIRQRLKYAGIDWPKPK